MEASKQYIPAVKLGLDTHHSNTNTSAAEFLARLSYARERIHTTRVMPLWSGLSHETRRARQDAVCAVLDIVYHHSRAELHPADLFKRLTIEAGSPEGAGMMARHEAAAP